MVGAQLIVTSQAVIAAESSEKLEELERQREELQSESSQIESDIEGSRDSMNKLSEEKASLQSEITSIQANVDQLLAEISQSEAEIAEKESEIERLHKEIDTLIDLINKRTDKLDDQARAVQQTGNASNMIDALLSSDSLADLLDRAKFITEIVSSNQSIVSDQKRDQEALEKKEEQVALEQAELEEKKKSLEVSRNNLVNQRLAMEDRVAQVSAEYDLSEKDLNKLLGQKDELAAKTSELDEQVKAEQDRLEQERIAREKREKEEAERLKREEEQRAREAKEREKRQAREAEAKAASEEQATANRSVEAAASSEAPAQQSSGWIRPASGYISSHFGYRIHPVYGTRRLHAGVDFAGTGTVRASKAGTVVAASYTGGLGYHVRIDHGGGMSSVYGHMQPGLHVAPGQTVTQGQSLGLVGSSGTSTGIHLHFEIHQNGVPVNPMSYL